MFKTLHCVVVLSLLYIIPATYTDGYQCSATKKAQADHDYNQVGYVKGSISNATIIEKLIKFTHQKTGSGSTLKEHKLGIYTYQHDPTTHIAKKVRFLIYTKVETNPTKTSSQINFGNKILDVDAIGTYGIALTESNDNKFYLQRFFLQNVDTSTPSISSKKFLLSNEFMDAQNSNKFSKAETYIFKGLIQRDSQNSLYTLWQVSKFKHAIYKSTASKTYLVNQITTIIGAQLTCSSRSMCYDHVNQQAFTLVDGQIASRTMGGTSKLPLPIAQQYDVQSFQLKSIPSASGVPMFRFINKAGNKATTYYFRNIGINPTFGYLEHIYNSPLSNVFRGINGEVAEYDKITSTNPTKTRKLSLIMGKQKNSKTAVVHLNKAIDQNLVRDDILSIGFKTDGCYILTRNQMIQLSITVTVKDPGDVTSYNSITFSNTGTDTNIISIIRTIKLSNKVNQLINKPMNQMWMVIRNMCICVDHNVSDMTCFDDFQCIVSIDYQEKDCSDYSTSGSP